jgi:hypothetical protein
MFWGRVEAGKNIYIWAGRMWFWFIPKTASMASSSTGALVAAGSLQPGEDRVNSEISLLCFYLEYAKDISRNGYYKFGTHNSKKGGGIKS